MSAGPIGFSRSESTPQAFFRFLPAASAPARGRTFFRPAASTGLIAFAFDPDHREYQNGSHTFEWDAIETQDRSSRCRVRRKFKDGAHITLISVIAARTQTTAPRHAPNRIRTWLTAS
jgi:hypothetical protein